MVNVGFKNYVNDDKIIVVVDCTIKSMPIIRAINNARDMGMVIDVTMGRTTNSVIFTDSDHVILSHLGGPTITKRIEEAKKCLIK